MLFFQGFVLRIAVCFIFMKIIWNVQKWIEAKRTKKFIQKDILEPIINNALTYSK